MARSKHPFLSSVINDLWYEERTDTRQGALNNALAVRDAIPHANDAQTATLQALLARILLGTPDAASLHAAAREHAPDAVVPADDAATGEIRRELWTLIRAMREEQSRVDVAATARIDAVVAAMKSAHPDLGLSFGYIGNLPSNGWDERSWKVFAKLATSTCFAACDVSFGGHATRDLAVLADRVEADLPAWCAKQQERLAAGDLRIVGDRLAA